MTAISEARVRGSKANAIGDGDKLQKAWIAKGHIRVRNKLHYVEKRIYAPNKDAAIAEAHAHGMSVRECIQILATRK